MGDAIWVVVCSCFALATLAVVHFAPVQHRHQEQVVQVCGENGTRLKAPAGFVACQLKNGQVINLRSSK